jgi:hypothetical protein
LQVTSSAGHSRHRFWANRQHPATVGDSDDIFYDPDRKLIYVIGGEGAMEVLRQHDPNNYERVERITTPNGKNAELGISEKVVCSASRKRSINYG